MVATPAQLSPLLVASPVWLGSLGSPQASCRSAGQVICGGVVSTKLIICSQVELLLHESVAFQVRLMPGWPVQLAGSGASLKVIVTGPPQLSPLVVAWPVWLGSVDSPHCNSLLGGQVISGGVVSSNERCWTQVATL